MKSKRLLILIAVVAIVLVVMIVLSAVFSVKNAWVVFHRFDGTTISVPSEGAPTIDDVLKQTEGKNIIFLSKSETLKNLQTDNWHAISVVKSFPNKITVHYIERALAAKIVVNGETIYIDSMGNVIAKPENDTSVNISSAFAVFDVASQEINQPLKFNTDENNNRLQQVLQAILAVWRCNIELPDVKAVIGDNAFTYENGSLVITMPSTAKIVVNAPQKNLQDRLLKAFSVYFNANKNLQQAGRVITVREDGKITTDK